MNDEKLAKEAIDFVKANKQLFINAVCDGALRNEHPIAVFMAGTPGAGKTEIAKSLIELFDIEPCRIDADDFRELIPGYTGDNSRIVQAAASLAVDKVQDVVLDKHFSFILDGTFAIGKSIVNIKRAIRKDFEVQIYFVYQDPQEAWAFTKIREEKEGRHVPKETFINAYYESRNNVKAVKGEFGDQVTLRVIIKSYKNQTYDIYDDVQDLDKVLPNLYNKDELREVLND